MVIQNKPLNLKPQAPTTLELALAKRKAATKVSRWGKAKDIAIQSKPIEERRPSDTKVATIVEKALQDRQSKAAGHEILIPKKWGKAKAVILQNKTKRENKLASSPSSISSEDESESHKRSSNKHIEERRPSNIKDATIVDLALQRRQSNVGHEILIPKKWGKAKAAILQNKMTKDNKLKSPSSISSEEESDSHKRHPSNTKFANVVEMSLKRRNSKTKTKTKDSNHLVSPLQSPKVTTHVEDQLSPINNTEEVNTEEKSSQSSLQRPEVLNIVQMARQRRQSNASSTRWGKAKAVVTKTEGENNLAPTLQCNNGDNAKSTDVGQTENLIKKSMLTSNDLDNDIGVPLKCNNVEGTVSHSAWHRPGVANVVQMAQMAKAQKTSSVKKVGGWGKAKDVALQSKTAEDTVLGSPLKCHEMQNNFFPEFQVQSQDNINHSNLAGELKGELPDPTTDRPVSVCDDKSGAENPWQRPDDANVVQMARKRRQSTVGQIHLLQIPKGTLQISKLGQAKHVLINSKIIEEDIEDQENYKVVS